MYNLTKLTTAPRFHHKKKLVNNISGRLGLAKKFEQQHKKLIILNFMA
jgi:hypothetical protein